MILPKLLARLRRRNQAEGITDQFAENTAAIGQDAQRLLDDPLLRLCFQALDDDLIERWKRTKVGDRRGREALYRFHVALVELDGKLRSWVGDAKAIELARRAEEQPERRVA